MNKQIYVRYLEFCKQDTFKLIKVLLSSAITSLCALSALEQIFLECLYEPGTVQGARNTAMSNTDMATCSLITHPPKPKRSAELQGPSPFLRAHSSCPQGTPGGWVIREQGWPEVGSLVPWQVQEAGVKVSD